MEFEEEIRLITENEQLREENNILREENRKLRRKLGLGSSTKYDRKKLLSKDAKKKEM